MDNAAGTVDHVGAWTSDGWFATIRNTWDRATSTGTSELALFPRTGPGGGTLGTPQTIPLEYGGTRGPIGESILAVPTYDGARFYVLDGGTWVEAGSMTVPWPFQVVDMTDDWLVVRRPLGEVGDASVQIYSVQRTVNAVTVALDTTLLPDPSWDEQRRAEFGAGIALDGDLLAVIGGGAGGGPLVQVYRHGPGGWGLTQTIGDGVAYQRSTAIDIDDGPNVDRLVMSSFAAVPGVIGVDVWADTGSGFVVEQTIDPDPAVPDTGAGYLFGAVIAMDGDVLAVSSRMTQITSSEPGHDPVTVGHVQVYRHDGTWAAEQDLAPFPDPFDPDIRQIFPLELHVSGDHVAADMVTFPDPPDPCPFPCINLGAEVWTASRY